MSEPLPDPGSGSPSEGRSAPATDHAAQAVANPPWARGLRGVALMATDFASLCASGAVAYLLWALPMRHQSPEMYLRLLPLLALFVVGFAAAGLYPGFGLGPVETLRRLSLVTSFGFLILAAITFALKLPNLYSRVTFAIAYALALLAVPLARALVGASAGRSRWWREPVAVVAPAEEAERLVTRLGTAGPTGYRPAAILVSGSSPMPREVLGLPCLGGLEHASALAGRGIRTALVAGRASGDAVLVDRLQPWFRHVLVVRPALDLPVEGVQIRNLGGAFGIEYTNNLLLHRNRLLKRLLDLLVGGLLALLTLPLLAAAALAVKLASPGPAFFRQQRAGLGGRPFRVPKIRTMHPDAERRLADHLERHPDQRREWEARFKLHDDPRLIPVLGPFLRRFSLDELPQLWSVVRGDMSLVGPRPFPDYHLARFPEEFLQLRQRVRPGITGLWQVTVRSEGSLDEQRAFDGFYIRNWSPWLDLYLLARTFGAVASGRGAY